LWGLGLDAKQTGSCSARVFPRRAGFNGEDVGRSFFFVELDDGPTRLEGLDDPSDIGAGIGEIGTVARDEFFDEALKSFGTQLVVGDLHVTIVEG